MTVARSSGFLLGTAVGTGVTITNTSTSVGSEVDVLGNDTSEGWVNLFLYYTSTVTAGSLDVTIFYSQITGDEAEDQSSLVASITPANATQKIFIGSFPVSRYMIGQVKNNATGASATNVSIGYELFKES